MGPAALASIRRAASSRPESKFQVAASTHALSAAQVGLAVVLHRCPHYAATRMAVHWEANAAKGDDCCVLL